jgi:hypothetical protein
LRLLFNLAGAVWGDTRWGDERNIYSVPAHSHSLSDLVGAMWVDTGWGDERENIK